MFWSFQERKQVYRERVAPYLNESRANTGQEIARNKNSCNKNSITTVWEYCSCLQLSRQFFLRNKEISHKIA